MSGGLSHSKASVAASASVIPLHLPHPLLNKEGLGEVPPSEAEGRVGESAVR
jgi:hypothetical protein